jgi:hypothetical protein
MKKIVTLMMAFGVLVGGLSFGGSADAHYLDTLGSPSGHHSGAYYNNVFYSNVNGFVIMDTLEWGSSAGTKHTLARVGYKNPGGDPIVSVKFTNSTADGNDYDGEVLFYLQRLINGTWTSVSHFGTSKNTGQWVERDLVEEYGGKPIIGGATYRLKFSSTGSEITRTSFAVPTTWHDITKQGTAN